MVVYLVALRMKSKYEISYPVGNGDVKSSMASINRQSILYI